MAKIQGLARNMKSDYRRGRGAPVASDLNTVVRLLKRAEGRGGISTRTSTSGGLIIDGGAAPVTNSTRAFGIFQTGEQLNQVRILPGDLVFHGSGIYGFAETELTISGGPYVWVFCQATINGWGSRTIEFGSGSGAGDKPKTGDGKFRGILWEITWNAAKSRYNRAISKSGGDIHIMAPLVP